MDMHAMTLGVGDALRASFRSHRDDCDRLFADLLAKLR
jgi:hypothetical protein